MKDKVVHLMNEAISMGARITQNIDELTFLFASIKNTQAQSYMEIGSEYGGSLYVLSHALPPGSIIQSIDYPLNDKKSNVLKSVLKRIETKGYVTGLISGDSHSEDVLEQVRGLHTPASIDILFIDGDHSYTGVKKDYDTYSEFVKTGGLIAFHDVSIPYDKEQSACEKDDYDTRKQKRRDVEVSLFWNNIVSETCFRSIEINAGKQRPYGIGILQNKVIGTYLYLENYDGNSNHTNWR
jgi:predicted O-methyltransferase YrrM